MNLEIRTQLFNLVNRAPSIASNLFWAQASDDWDASNLSVVMSEIIDVASRDTGAKYSEINFQIAIYCALFSEGESIRDEIITLIETQNQYLTFTNYKFINLRFDNSLHGIVDNLYRRLVITATLELEVL